MTTALQHEANRRNASLSTGPRTEAGKARSAGNALKHGLTSRLGVAIDRGPFAELSTGPRTEAGKARSAGNALTHGLTSRLGVAIDRGPFAEDPVDVEFFISEVVRGLEPQRAQEWAEAVHIGAAYVRLQRLLRLESAAMTASTRLTVTEVLDPLAHLDDTTSAERTACRALDSSLLDRLPRYESHLSRELDRSLARYRQLQATRTEA